MNRLQLLSNLINDIPADADNSVQSEIMASRIVEAGMSSFVIMMLESIKPISFIASQATLIATPLLGSYINPIQIERFSKLIENREFIERLLTKIEEKEREKENKKLEIIDDKQSK
ncbi:MAG: hypothetical protein WCO98_10635 [bacterium]